MGTRGHCCHRRVLIVSCLLGVLCCCCRRARRRKPRDKEAVGLGSAQGTTTAHLVQPEVDDVESSPGGAQQWGLLRLSLEYDFGSQEVPRAELPGTTLRVQVLDFRCFSGHVLELWHQLGPPGTAEAQQMGELCFLLQYVPSSGRLTVVMLEAWGLSLGPAESYVKAQLTLNRREWKKRKTSARKGTATPYFNEACPSARSSVDLVLAVWAGSLRLRAEPVGKVVLGTRASGQPLQHWAEMLAHARRPVAQWHRLQPLREVDGALALQSLLHLPLPGS